MSRTYVRATAAAVFGGLFAVGQVALAATVPSFQGLGDLPGGSVNSFAHEVSGDGTTVVGMSVTSVEGQDFGRAYRWTAGTGMTALGNPPTTKWPISATGVSSDGSVVVGRADQTAYRWTATTGLVDLGTGANFNPESYARGVSGDGNVVVGDSGLFLPSLNRGTAFRWTAAGMSYLPPIAAGDSRSVAYDANTDGSVVVGRSGGAGNSGEAFRWVAGVGTIGLGDIDSESETHLSHDSQANATNADGSVVVGFGTPSIAGRRAARWTAGTGMLALANGVGYSPTSSQAWDVSADGSVIVGDGSLAAFIWTADTGMRRLQDVLSEAGIDLTGWALQSARSVSADGTTITGYGTHDGNQEAFIAVIPEPAAAGLAAVLGMCMGLRRGRRPRRARAAALA